MPAVSRTGRKKRWHHKDFNGCIKCKQRRVKCGSEKPACLRCQKLGVVCPGYQPPKARIFELRRQRDFHSDEDRTNYDFFLRSGSKIVALSQATSEPFWSRLVLQLAESNGIIKHGLIALGALLRPLHANPSSQKYGALCTPHATTKHSAAAMHKMKSAALGAVSPEVAVACCLVSAELDRWLEKETSPVLQILSAYRLLQERRRSNTAGSNTTQDECQQLFEPMVDELIVDTCSCADNFPTLTSGLMSNYQLASGLDRAKSITTYMDALHGVASLLKAVFRSTCPYIVATTAEMDDISFALDTVGHKLQHFHGDGELPVEYQLLQVHHRVARIMFYTLGRNNEFMYDAFHYDFCFIVEQLEQIITASERAGEPTTTGQSVITPTLGLIPPLFLVATKCRDTPIRQQASQLLHGMLRSERGWTSCMAATISQFVIQEELRPGTTPLNPDGLCERPLPRQPRRRIKLDEVEFSSREDKIYLAYTAYSKVDDSPGSKRIASIPYCSHPSVEKNNTTCQMSRKVLRHCGYTGVILFSPQIECHCVRGDTVSAKQIGNKFPKVGISA
ncbi:uncharacterized protein PV07_07354 [Cladophialophora immunda]|uniref:Zn(2)-C6 fungal-type domain-containing protein n=1 Tax=Cladophialophora immunda TaxID=569365 RepID=A0A0D2CVA7_9EURO|nr:uncharacterized protein PV07_07354 [Cladophialophora immunda]KIW27629.1 hypothetical protein PV07_07354 [Cladophialophora immunda]